MRQIINDKEDRDMNPNNNADHEIDLIEIFNILWARKILIIFLTLISCVLSVLYALSLPNIYQSSATIAAQEQIGGGGSTTGVLAGVASMAGVDLSADADKVQHGMKIMTSYSFIEDFIDKHGLLVPLMAANGWDREKNQLIINSKIYNSESGQWVRKPSPTQNPQPSLQEAHREFLEILDVKKDKRTGLIEVSIEFFSPHLAKEWVSLMIEDVNSLMRDKDVMQAQKSIEYLSSEIGNTTYAEVKTALSDLIQSQTRTIMVARSTPEYVFQTLDPAYASEYKLKPKRAILCIIGAIVGFLLSLASALIVNKFRPKV